MLLFINYLKIYKKGVYKNEKDIYGDTADRCLELMQEFYGENFKAIFDPANFVQAGEDTKRAYEMMKHYIGYMHIKDARKEKEDVSWLYFS